MSQDTQVEGQVEVEVEKRKRSIDYASQITDSPEVFRERAESYKKEDGSYSVLGQRCLFLADIKEFPSLSLSKLSRKHDKAPATCKMWVDLYLEGGIDKLVAPAVRSGGGRPNGGGAPPKLQAEHIDIVREFCDQNHVTSIEQIRDHLIEVLGLTSLGLTPIRTLLDRNNLHLGTSLYVADGQAVKRTRKTKTSELEEGMSDTPDDEDVEDSEVEDDGVEESEAEKVEDDGDDAEESKPVEAPAEKPKRGRSK